MANPTDPKQLDKRTAERYLRSGAVDEKAYQRHIETLPDVSEKSVPVETVMHDELENDEDDDFEDDEDEGDEDSESDE
ncbi:hypothetical protein ATI61_108475 [Archangium gephyra]|jgi:hypothetical protein|uniref:Uncharacterized protein n=1 Tax=Archangium gephyra TaxID=48 RepID=A0AAC8Q7V6_9BACT|nr:hypothetical protein [Archangium gephyra]AKJ02136.1 Hypothetical protein AA314_03762 [Archangium gephyra]REG28932.1 hypothetical protein ATI61_108475 [Archangium gephyra]